MLFRALMIADGPLLYRYDPDQLNINSTVSGKCTEAVAYCYANIQGPYDVYSNVSSQPRQQRNSS